MIGQHTINYHKRNDNAKENVMGVFLLGKLSATLVIPAEIAHQCNLDGEVIIEKRNGGIFIYRPRFQGQNN